VKKIYTLNDARKARAMADAPARMAAHLATLQAEWDRRTAEALKEHPEIGTLIRYGKPVYYVWKPRYTENSSVFDLLHELAGGGPGEMDN